MKRVIKLKESDLRAIINNSVKSVLKEAFDFDFQGQHYHFKDGDEKKGQALYKKLVAQFKREQAIARGEQPPEEPTKKPGKKKKEGMGDEQASPKALAANVKKLVSDQALISVKGFISNGERQFGPNAIKTLVNIFKKEANDRDLFVIYNSIYRNIETTIDEIENWGRKDEYAVYERASKLAYLLRDMDEVLEEMARVYRALVDNKVIERTFGNSANVIMGNGHSLGLRSLIFAKGTMPLTKVTGNLLYNASKLEEIAKNGRDPFDYDPNNLRKRG